MWANKTLYHLPRFVIFVASYFVILPHSVCDFSLMISVHFYARKQLLLSAPLSHRNSVCLSVCLSGTRVDQSKTVQARITKSSPLAAGKTLVLGTFKLFHKFEGGYPERGR